MNPCPEANPELLVSNGSKHPWGRMDELFREKPPSLRPFLQQFMKVQGLHAERKTIRWEVLEYHWEVWGPTFSP